MIFFVGDVQTRALLIDGAEVIFQSDSMILAGAEEWRHVPLDEHRVVL